MPVLNKSSLAIQRKDRASEDRKIWQSLGEREVRTVYWKKKKKKEEEEADERRSFSSKPRAMVPAFHSVAAQHSG